MLDGSKAGKSKSRADDSQASKNAAALNAADAAKKRAEALIAEAMSQARTSLRSRAASPGASAVMLAHDHSLHCSHAAILQQSVSVCIHEHECTGASRCSMWQPPDRCQILRSLT